MCAVSMVGDDWTRKFPERYPSIWPTPSPTSVPYPSEIPVSRKEFERLKADVEQMKKDLAAAKAQDIADGAPDCEMEDKVALLKKVAELVGVDLEEIFGK